MKRSIFLLVALAVATAASAQTATRRSTNIASLIAYPGFYHGRPILMVGTVTTTDNGLRVSDDSGSIRLLSKGPAPEGLDEIRGEFWDIGRMKPDEPQLAGYDLKRTFNVDPGGAWPRPGEVTAIIATAVSQAQLPAAPSIRAIALNPSRYVDQKVTVTGQFGGRNLFGDLPDSPGKSRYDFVLRSADSAIWVSGAQPKGKGFNLSLDARIDTGRWLEITGVVRMGRGLEWLDVGGDGIQLGKAPTDTPPADTEPIRVSAAAAAGGRLQHADAGRNRRLDEHQRPDSVFARHRSEHDQGARARALPRLANRRARRADDADGRVHDAVHRRRAGCWS